MVTFLFIIFYTAHSQSIRRKTISSRNQNPPSTIEKAKLSLHTSPSIRLKQHQTTSNNDNHNSFHSHDSLSMSDAFASIIYLCQNPLQKQVQVNNSTLDFSKSTTSASRHSTSTTNDGMKFNIGINDSVSPKHSNRKTLTTSRSNSISSSKSMNQVFLNYDIMIDIIMMTILVSIPPSSIMEFTRNILQLLYYYISTSSILLTVASEILPISFVLSSSRPITSLFHFVLDYIQLKQDLLYSLSFTLISSFHKMMLIEIWRKLWKYTNHSISMIHEWIVLNVQNLIPFNTLLTKDDNNNEDHHLEGGSLLSSYIPT